MATDSSDNNTLYFIVGGLVVLALIISFVYMGNNGNLAATEPAAGVPVTESTTNNYTIESPEPAPVERETNITVTPPATETEVNVNPPAAD
jgi:hypothetical protein